ncbi:hypothetical protein PR003_g26997 [Phytophthora rubi]|uniref:Uncharacterized protein n=1 Tax=Phytophthora rubi TaxID=129364 RepID=A0A6A3I1R9_9STRA|nr:hypothetical protein PR002_g25951 [Phytophthora rubi]KAE9283917.1 hypothetical protein PR003_g26997 [Phytophthora rubi]
MTSSSSSGSADMTGTVGSLLHQLKPHQCRLGHVRVLRTGAGRDVLQATQLLRLPERAGGQRPGGLRAVAVRLLRVHGLLRLLAGLPRDDRPERRQRQSAQLLGGGLYHQYPSVNSTYCEATDPACLECNTVAVNYSMQNNYLAMTTKFCVGASGCVCVLSCDPLVWKLRTVSLCDDSDSASASQSSASSSSWSPYTTSPSIIVNRASSSSFRYLYWLLGIPAFIVLLVSHYCIRLKFIEIRRRRLLQIPRRSPRDRLRLSAWRELHEQLIDKEKAPVASVACHIAPITSVQEERPL